MIASQRDAKRFFVDRIVDQAMREGHPLSDNERWMLDFSESDPDFVVDPARAAALEAAIPSEQYEEKIAGLARRACEADVASDPGALQRYREAYKVLNKGDHYILVMLAQGLAPRLRPWWALFR